MGFCAIKVFSQINEHLSPSDVGYGFRIVEQNTTSMDIFGPYGDLVAYSLGFLVLIFIGYVTHKNRKRLRRYERILTKIEKS